MADDKNLGTHNVTSHNQSGGITAHTVHIGRPQFELTQDHIDQVLSAIPLGSQVILRSVGNQRAHQMGHVLSAALTGSGFLVERHIIGMLSPPPDGPLIVQPGAGRTIVTIAPNA